MLPIDYHISKCAVIIALWLKQMFGYSFETLQKTNNKGKQQQHQQQQQQQQQQQKHEYVFKHPFENTGEKPQFIKMLRNSYFTLFC